MSGRRRAATALAVATLFLAATPRAVAAPSPWELIVQQNRRRCAQLLDEAAALVAAHQLKPAATAARSAAALCPTDAALLQGAGETLLDAREYADGRRALERARALSSTTPLARDRDLALAFHLGFAREVTGDLEGAIAEHRRLEAMGGLPAPNQYLVHYNLGDELMAVGRLDDAIDGYRRAAVLAPGRSIVRLALAVALDRNGQLDQARGELAAALALDPELRALTAEDYVFVPAADVHYYRAIALVERGAVAEARLALRGFLAELPAGPYSAHARARLVELERRVDPRELEVSAAGVDTRLVAHALGPEVAALEACLPAQRLVHIRFQVTRAGLRPDSEQPAADCLIRGLDSLDSAGFASAAGGFVTVPLAGRRAAASLP